MKPPAWSTMNITIPGLSLGGATWATPISFSSPMTCCRGSTCLSSSKEKIRWRNGNSATTRIRPLYVLNLPICQHQTPARMILTTTISTTGTSSYSRATPLPPTTRILTGLPMTGSFFGMINSPYFRGLFQQRSRIAIRLFSNFI